MDLSYRPMRASDVAACVDLIKSDRILGPRYGPAIRLLVRASLHICQINCFDESRKSAFDALRKICIRAHVESAVSCYL